MYDSTENYCSTDRPNVTQGQITRNLETECLTCTHAKVHIFGGPHLTGNLSETIAADEPEHTQYLIIPLLEESWF